MAKKKGIRATSSGSFFGLGTGKNKRRGKPAKRISTRQHRELGTLNARNRAAAHSRRKHR